MKRSVAIATALSLSLGACASYTPEPLAVAHSSLAAPVSAVLEKQANDIKRPWLAPVKVDLSKPLTAEGLAALAVANNPDLKALRARENIASAQVYAAGLLPDPTFSAGASKNLKGPDPFLEIPTALGFDLNSLRTLSVRRKQAEANRQKVRLDLAWAEWQTAGQARILGVQVESLRRIVALARSSRDTAQSLLERITRATSRGDLPAGRMQAARLAVLSADATYYTAKKNLAAATVKLTQVLGLPPDFPLRLAKFSLPHTPPPTKVLFPLAKANRTDLAALRAGYASQQASVHKAVLDQFPNLTLTLNATRDSAGNHLVGPAVDFTLPLWNRNRGTIAVQRATRQALRSEYDARLFKTRADIAAAEAGISVAQHRRKDALSHLPYLERYAKYSQQAAKRGDLSLEAAQNAEQSVRDVKIQLAQASRNYAEQMIALELLTGTPKGAWPQ